MSTTATKSQPGRTGKGKAASGTGKASKSSTKTKRASAKSKNAAAKTKRTSAGSKTANKDGGKRLGPGQLDGMVLGYMKKNRDRLPVTAGTVGRGIKRSAGAVANCLARLDQAGEVKLTNQKPREFDLVGGKGKNTNT